jgi:glycosyltransferase involved in cell wall biosynthesis
MRLAAITPQPNLVQLQQIGDRPMRIAQVAPLQESVPPKAYGGTERVVSCLTEELVRRGHDVTLFASGDSETAARLVACSDQALRLNPAVEDFLPYEMVQLGKVSELAREFDIIHSHIDLLAFPFQRLVPIPMVHTMHGRMDLPDLPPALRAFPELNLVSISNDQRTPYPDGHWIATVYNGICVENFNFREKRQNYLAFIGRFSPEKGPDKAIEISKQAGLKLKLAAKIDKPDEEYYESIVKPLLDHPLIEYVGEINEDQKDEFLGNACATLFPIDWPEPFGLTMVESMACGTPVIATRCGSVPEVIDDGRTGFICDSLDGMVQAIRDISKIDRRACREHVVQRFSDQAMTTGYVEVYDEIIVEASRASGCRPCSPIQRQD